MSESLRQASSADDLTLDQAMSDSGDTHIDQPTLISNELGDEAISLLLFSSATAEWRAYNDFARPQPPSFKDDAEVAGTAFDYLASKPIGYQEKSEEMDPVHGKMYELALGGTGVAHIDFWVNGATAEIGYIGVDEKFTHHGLGGRLMRAAVTFMKSQGVTELRSPNLTGDALGLRERVFGADKLDFYYTKKHHEAGRQDPPPANMDEAWAIVNEPRAVQDEADTYEWPPTFGVRVNLTDIDTSGWEYPQPAKIGEVHVAYEYEGSRKTILRQ